MILIGSLKLKKEGNNRIWELDFFRGIALLLMTYFHVLYDLSEIYGYGINYNSGVNYIIGKTSAVLFIFISGVSCSLSRNNVKRGFKTFILGIIITLATWSFDSRFVILFGILHFLGLCMMLSVIFVKLNHLLLWGAGLMFYIFALVIKDISVPYDYLALIGLKSDNFISSDYYPLIPWMGVFFFGLGTGKIIYSQRKSIFGFDLKENMVSRAGRHTLLYYILHQPIIIGVIALLRYMFKK